MPIDQFADVSKDLCMQIKLIENLLKQNLFNEADELMQQATKCCRTLESLMAEDNKIQTRIVANRQKEITWIQDAIQGNIKKTVGKSAKKRKTKI
jgi:P2-related tail formation protein